ncbi:MAG: hypothetical protein HKM23_08120 [Nitrosopumilus sp.]|nr:hypothetical protein [Nitrosopumilus sp.]NND87267.1 hypothetical protein [Nitrosopumilus sp.]NNL53467.1 hypothetical protein [Nitrosopumilus sp.]NNM02820.1 hypothetical protein [Nitrosopumilus sp.]
MRYIFLIIAGISISSIIALLVFQLNLDTESTSKIEMRNVDPEKICVDLFDMGFSSMQECIDFVNGMLIKINDYSQSIDCEEHQLLFDKLGIECT